MKSIIVSVILSMLSFCAYANEASELYTKNFPTDNEMGVKVCELTSYSIIGSKLVKGFKRNGVILVEDGNTFSFKYGITATSGDMDKVDVKSGTTWSTNDNNVFHRMREDNGKLKYVYENNYIKRVYVLKNCINN